MNSSKPLKIIAIVGSTASGKSELALKLAASIDAEIVNADSMQVYQGMDIGTAKLSIQERAEIPHHLLDIITPDQSFSASDYLKAATKAINEITSRAKHVIIVGGTGLYIRALLKGLIDSPGGATELRAALHKEALSLGNQAMLDKLAKVDPESASRIHCNNLVRIIRALEVFQITGVPLSKQQEQHSFSGKLYNCLQVGISVDRQELYDRINRRVEFMFANGLLDEVRYLLDKGYHRELKAMRAIGYKETTAYLSGEQSLEKAKELIKLNTRHYAKRQLTWFKGDPDILWLEYPVNFATIIKKYYEFN